VRARRDAPGGERHGRTLAALVRWRSAELRAVRLALAAALEAEREAEVEAAAGASDEIQARREVARLAACLAPPGQEGGLVPRGQARTLATPARADDLARRAAEASGAARRLEDVRALAASAVAGLRARREASEAVRLGVWRAQAAAEVAAGAAAAWLADQRRAREERADEDGPGR
jgi:hypothetical protein